MNKLVAEVISAYSKKTGLTATSLDFFKNAGISRQMFYWYRHGAKPGTIGINGIAKGIKAWGFKVVITK